MKTSLILIGVSLTLGAIYTQPALFVILLPFVALVALIFLAPSKKASAGSIPALAMGDIPGLLIEFLFSPPFLITAAVIIFYIGLASIANLLDATTVAIISPSAVLIGLLIAASLKKGLLPSKERLSVLLFGLALNIVVFKLFWMNIYWGDAASLQTDFWSRVFARSYSLSFNSILSFLCTLPVVFFANLWLFRNDNRFEIASKISMSLAAGLLSGVIFCSFLPIAWIYLSGHPFEQVPSEVRWIARDSMRCIVAFSTVGSSLAGLLIAFSGPIVLNPPPRPEHIPKPLSPIQLRAILALLFVFLSVNFGLYIRSHQPLLCGIRGVFCTKAGRYNDAFAAFDEALRLRPDYGGLYQERAYTCTKLRKVDEAVRDFSRAVELGSVPSHYHFLEVINKCFEEKRPELVVSLCSKVIAKYPEHLDGLEYRGVAYTKLGDMDHARKDFGKCIAIKPSSPYSYLRRSMMFKRFGAFEHAFADASKAISKAPDWELPYEVRGSILMDLNCPQFALNDLNKAIELCPKYGTAYFTRSKIEAALGMTAESQRDLAIAVERNSCVEQCDFYRE